MYYYLEQLKMFNQITKKIKLSNIRIIEQPPPPNRPNNYERLIELVEKDFEPLQKIYNWGSNPYYFLAGMKNIHPSYVQDLLQN